MITFHKGGRTGPVFETSSSNPMRNWLRTLSTGQKVEVGAAMTALFNVPADFDSVTERVTLEDIRFNGPLSATSDRNRANFQHFTRGGFLTNVTLPIGFIDPASYTFIFIFRGEVFGKTLHVDAPSELGQQYGTLGFSTPGGVEPSPPPEPPPVVEPLEPTPTPEPEPTPPAPESVSATLKRLDAQIDELLVVIDGLDRRLAKLESETTQPGVVGPR